MRTVLSPRARRVYAGLSLATAAAAAAALVLVAAHRRADAPTPAPVRQSYGFLQGAQSSVMRHDRLVLRATADTITVGQPRALGLFRVGFLRAVAARNLTVETWEAAPVTDFLSGVLAGSAAVPPAGPKHIAHVSAERVRFVVHRAGSEVVQLDAHMCETTLRHQLLCRYGSLRDGPEPVRFREAVYDSGHWTLDGREPAPRS